MQKALEIMGQFQYSNVSETVKKMPIVEIQA